MKRIIGGVVVGVLLVVFGLGLLVFTGGSYKAQESACETTGAQFGPIDVGIGDSPVYDDPDQIFHAKLIIGIGLARDRTLREIKVALMVAMQESWLRNLNWGDADSLGLFQQRPSVGVWGTAEEIMDPVHATNKFYEALEKVKNRDSMSLFELAVEVQRPDRAAYAKTFDSQGPPADAFLEGVDPGTDPPYEITPPSEGCAPVLQNVETAVQAALSQVGKPYRWEQPVRKEFDAGELMQWSYAQAGATLPMTAVEQYKAGPRVTPPTSGSQADWAKELVRGDLIYWDDLLGSVNHVSMYLGNNQIVDALGPKKDVIVTTIDWESTFRVIHGAVRPIDESNDDFLLPGEWQWPLKNISISSPYGMRYHPYLRIWRLHAGVDFAAPWNTPIYAPHDATVESITVTREGGNVLLLNHGGGLRTRYLHLANTNGMRPGQPVKKGQLVANSGNTGCCSTGPHLHFEVRLNGTPTDPIAYMRQYGLYP